MVYENMRKRQEAGRSILLAAVMPSKGDGAGTDTFWPHRAYGQLRNTENRQRLRGLATASLMPHRRLIAVPPCSFSLLPIRTFTTARPPAACFSSPRVETVIIRLPALSVYHRLALPGLGTLYAKGIWIFDITLGNIISIVKTVNHIIFIWDFKRSNNSISWGLFITEFCVI